MNVLLITTDQHHYQALGFRDSRLRTPNLDRLAAGGTVFNRAYCPNPTCTPTRASIITGRYPSQHGAWSLGTKLPESEHTVGEDFQRAGYRTCLIGKAHFQMLQEREGYTSLESYPKMQDLEFWRHFHGPFYGFDHVELARNHADEAHVGQHYALWMEERGFKDWRDCFVKPTGRAAPQRWRWNLPEEFHYNTWIAERSEAMLESYRRKGEPFFLWASFFDPHPPYLVPQPWDALYDPQTFPVPNVVPGEHERNPPHFRLALEAKPDFSAYQEPGGAGVHGFYSHLRDRATLPKDTAVYYGMVSLLDKYIGRILDRLAALGLAEETLVVFTTDHGHLLGQHGLLAKGAFHYEDLLRLPFVASLPGRIPAGRQTESLLSLVDLAPTFLDFCGIPIPRAMSGLSQRPVFLDPAQAVRRQVVVENRHQPTTVHLKTFIDQRYKLTVYFNRPYGELFDLECDPGEVYNLWDEPGCRELKARLLLDFLHAEMGKEPLWMPRVCSA